MNLTVMDQSLFTGGTSQSTASKNTANTQSSDRSSFDKMVRQKQTKQQDTQDNNTSSTQKTQTPQKNTTAKDTEIPDEQYVIAAAMMLQSALQIVDLQTDIQTPVEEMMTSEVFAPDMSPQTGAEIPIRELEMTPEETFTQNTDQDTSSQYESFEKPLVEYHEQKVEVVEEETTEETILEPEQMEAPEQVFGYMDAFPVQVSSQVTEPVDIQTPEGIGQLTGQLEQVIEEGGEQIEFTLVPASLGKVTVHITHLQDGALHIQLSASTLRAAAILERHADGLERLLSAPSRPTVEVEIRNNEAQIQQPFLDPNGNNQQEQQRQQQQRQREQEQQKQQQAQDFIQQLRLGLVGLSSVQ